jgi:hypothetical protein
MSDSFDLSGNGGNIGFSFGPQGAQPGASITGTILDMKEVQRTNYDTKKPEFWDNGDPKMQTRITLQTDLRDPSVPNDDGKRELYLDGRKKPTDTGVKSRICAVLDAVREATGGTSIQRGGRLTVTWVSGMGFSGDPRNYTASYAPPAMDLAGGGASAQQAPQVVQQAPAQQYSAPQAPAAQPPVQPQQPVAPQPVAQAPAGPDQAQIEALLAAQVDPRTVFPGVVLTDAQAARLPQPVQG